MIKPLPADVFDDRGENHKGKDDEYLPLLWEQLTQNQCNEKLSSEHRMAQGKDKFLMEVYQLTAETHFQF